MDYKQLIVDSGVKLYNQNLTVETWGNISFYDRKEDKVYITPSGMNYLELTKDDILVTDVNGKIIEGNRKPSIETPLHTLIYRTRDDVNAVIHTHPIYSTVFSSIGEDIPILHDEGAQALGGTVKTAKYALPGTDELAVNCIEALGNNNACLLKSHGAVCVASTMDGCFHQAVVLEMMANIYQKIRAMGETFEPISDENISAMWDFAHNCYGQK